MQKYDLAVIGAGLAGLSAAAILAQAGKAVILVDPASTAGGCLRAEEREAFHFSGGHGLTYGLEPGGAVQTVLASLGIAPVGPADNVTYQVALPDHRITVAADQRVTMEELRREFPAEIDRFVRLYREARALALKSAKSRIAPYILRWRSAKPVLRSYNFGPDATAYLDVQSRFFFGRPVHELSLASLVLLLDDSPRSLPGGFSRLAEELQSFIAERKGRVLMNEPWPELLLRGNRLGSMRTSEGAIEPHMAVVNASWGHGERTLLFGMREEALPIGMERNLLCLPDYAQPADFFFLSLSGAGEGAPSGTRGGTATFHGIEQRDVPVTALKERIGRIIPFLSDFLALFDERDPDARRFPLPERLLGKSRGFLDRTLPSAVAPLRNLSLIYDSACCVQEAVRSAQLLASKL